MAQHFEKFSGEVKERFLKSDDPFVVEIGSNDGIMLRNFAKAGIRHLGIEPSANVAEQARKNGVRTISKFFSKETAEEIVSRERTSGCFPSRECHVSHLLDAFGNRRHPSTAKASRSCCL